MSRNRLTLNEIAQLIGAAEARGADDIYQQLRGLHQKGVFLVSDHNGTRGAARFALQEVVRARILLALLDSGMGRNNISDVNSALNASNIDGSGATSRLGMFMDDLNTPATPWALHIDIIRNHTAEITLEPFFLRIGDMDHVSEETRPHTWGLKGHQRQARVSIYVSELVAPVLRKVASND
jgi:hypothetical protein